MKSSMWVPLPSARAQAGKAAENVMIAGLQEGDESRHRQLRDHGRRGQIDILRSIMILVRVIGLTAIAVVAIAGPVRGQEVSIEAVMERVGEYATAFQRQFSNVVTEERYVQDIRRINLPPNRFPAVSHRELRSDLL